MSESKNKGKLFKISAAKAVKLAANKFNITGDSWIGNAYQSIGHALEIMSLTGGFEPTTHTANTVSFKVKLPCSIDVLTFIEYEGCFLTLDRPTKYTSPTLKVHNLARGFIKGNYIQTNFETGEVIFHYLTFPSDKHGIPLIPNDGSLIEALTWIILRDWLSRGNLHPQFDWNMANQQWEIWWHRASNSVGFPKIINMDSFASMWVSLVPQNTLHLNGHLNYYGGEGGLELGDISEFTGPAIS